MSVPSDVVSRDVYLHEVEQYLIQMLHTYPSRVQEAGENYAPDIIAQYVFDLAKEYNRFYQEIAIFAEEDEQLLQFRVAMSAMVARVISHGMALLGIRVPEQM